MLLYMASRAQLVDEVVRPALAAGRVVVSDRFLLSSLVYQGFAGGLDVSEVAAVGRAATAGLLPDLTLVLDVPPEVAQSRTGPARDRIEDRPAEYQGRVREAFRRAVADSQPEPCPYYPAPLALIDASAAVEAVAARIRSEVGRVLALDPRA